MPTLVQLVNRVLSEIGKEPVSAIDTPAAQTIAAKINELFPELLLAAPWYWAIVYRNDDNPLPQTSNFSPDYVYTYQLPGDFGFFYKFATTGSQWPVYQITDGYLLAQIRPIKYYYVMNQNAAFTVMPPLFSRALVLYTAAIVAPTLTNNLQLGNTLFTKYEEKLSEAVIQNQMMNPIQTAPYNPFDRITFV